MTTRTALRPTALSVLVLAGLLAACDSERKVTAINWCNEVPTAGLPSLALTAGSAAAWISDPIPLREARSPFDDVFADAARAFDVPASVLRAIAFVETRWQMVEGREAHGRPAAYGVMALRGERLRRGAVLAGVSVDAARHDAAANIRAAAALLDAYATEARIDRTHTAAWYGVAERYSGIELQEGRIDYGSRVGAVLDRGLVRLPDGALATAPPRPVRIASTSIAGNDEDEDCVPRPPTPGGDAPDFEQGIWRPSPNFNLRNTDSTGVPHMVIVHTCEGSYSGCWSWLTNPISQVSAHYVVDELGTEVSQLVREKHRAWHIAARYRCWLNEGNDCWLNDVQSNHFTIGIEHAGYADQESWPEAQQQTAAALVCDITRDNDIPRDWQHIVGHGRLQPENRTDPGENWPWNAYMHRIQALCGEIVVDNRVARNDSARAAVAETGTWLASDSTPGYYGDGYRWAFAEPDTDDAVTFSFRLDAAAARTVDARWTAGSNRAADATFLVMAADGDTLATVPVDQTAGHEAWHELGTWSFPAGWNHVLLLRRGAPGAVVVADAVRIRE